MTASPAADYPARSDLFRAFHLTRLRDVRVTILGQDPYASPVQANGLALSVPMEEATPDQWWPPALSTRPIDTPTTMEMTGPAVLTSSRSASWADEPSRSATTVSETQASFPGARPTAWWTPTATRPTGTNTQSSQTALSHIGREWVKPLRAVVQRILADHRFGAGLPGGYVV